MSFTTWDSAIVGREKVSLALGSLAISALVWALMASTCFCSTANVACDEGALGSRAWAPAAICAIWAWPFAVICAERVATSLVTPSLWSTARLTIPTSMSAEPSIV